MNSLDENTRWNNYGRKGGNCILVMILLLLILFLTKNPDNYIPILIVGFIIILAFSYQIIIKIRNGCKKENASKIEINNTKSINQEKKNKEVDIEIGDNYVFVDTKNVLVNEK